MNYGQFSYAADPPKNINQRRPITARFSAAASHFRICKARCNRQFILGLWVLENPIGGFNENSISSDALRATISTKAMVSRLSNSAVNWSAGLFLQPCWLD
jgi:hypothetical protein